MTDRSDRLGRLYLMSAALVLALAALCGWAASLSHGWTGLAQSALPFQTLRPLHVTGSVAWIFLALLGGLTVFVPRVCERPWAYPTLAWWQFGLLAAAAGTALVGYLTGSHSGREYLNFGTATSLLIGIAWLLFLVNYIATVRHRPRPWPVYLWMWSTGVVLFTITFAEAHLWHLPFFGNSVVRDLTVQWKAYGALIGSWNLVVYGLSIYLAERVSGDRTIGSSRTAFAFYWLAVVVLTLGWAHHTYPVPQSLLLRRIAFAASMAEWVILLHLLWTWSARMRVRDMAPHREMARVFLAGAQFWIGVNLVLALLLSVPALNAVTHGTHVTLAHSMGATIGINSMILWGVGCLILLERRPPTPRVRWILRACVPWIHACLMGMFVCLLIAGSIKGKAMIRDGWSFATAMEAGRPFLRSFSVLGGGLACGVIALTGCWIVLGIRRPAAVPHSGPGHRMAWRHDRRPIPVLAYGLVVFGLAGVPWVLDATGGQVPETVLDRLPPGRTGLSEEGRVAFVQQGCWSCHLPDSEPPTPAPDLLSEGGRLSAGWHALHLYKPRWTRATSSMPSYPQLFVTDDDAAPELSSEGRAIVAYLLQLQQLGDRVLFDRAPATADHGFGPDDLYRMHCANCHGSEGRGDGDAAVFLRDESMPRNFRRGLFRIRSTPDLPTDEDLMRTITRGMPGSAMPDFGGLSVQDRRALVDIVQSFAEDEDEEDADTEDPGQADERRPVAIPEAPSPTPESLVTGRALVEQFRCALCHGADLQGLVAAEHGFTDWQDEAGRPVRRATDLAHDPYKCGEEPRDVYRTLYVGMGGSPMPSYGLAVPDDDDRWAVVHYVLSLRDASRTRR